MREKGIYGEESFCAVGGRYAVSDGSGIFDFGDSLLKSGRVELFI